MIGSFVREQGASTEVGQCHDIIGQPVCRAGSHFRLQQHLKETVTVKTAEVMIEIRSRFRCWGYAEL